MLPGVASSRGVKRKRRVERAEWQALAALDPAASAFHDPLFVALFAKSRPASQPAYLELRDAGGELVGGLPYLIQHRGPFRALASGPAGSYGGPIAASSEHRQPLVEAFLSEGRFTTLRREMLCRAELNSPPSALSPGQAGYLSLEGGFETFLRQRFPRNRRNECNRSERRGLVVHRESSVERVQRFHQILRENFIAWKTRPLELSFFVDVLEQLESFTLFVVEQEGEVLGGHLCCEHGDELFPWVGATMRREGVFPAPLLIREEARYAAEKGLSVLNLGASEGLSGVADFKRLLGASERTQWQLFREARSMHLWQRLRQARA